MLEGSILQKLTLAHKKNNSPLNLGVYYKNTLVALCHALEDFILASSSSPLVITAFQRGKWYLEEADRYGDLADKSQQIAIMATSDAGFAEHPTSNKDNVALVNLKPEDSVAEEWHLIIISPTYTAMVLCQELSENDYGVDGQPKEDLERKFYGFWTFEPDLVRETVELSIEHIGNYDRDLEEKLNNCLTTILGKSKEEENDNLSEVVSKVINYLQVCQEDLHQTNRADNFNFFHALDDNLLSNEMQAFLRMAQIYDRTDTSNPMAASEVSTLAEAMGQLLDLPAWQLKRLRLAGLLHKLGSLSYIKEKPDLKTSVQKEVLKNKDSLNSASVLRILPQLEAISLILTHKTEAWDGSGTPKNLAYDSIPLESRILRLVVDFQKKVTNYNRVDSNVNPIIKAINECQNDAGKIYDPKLIEVLNFLGMGMQQGMNIQTYQAKISGGIWLIDN